MADSTQMRMHKIVDELMKNRNIEPGSNSQKIVDLYSSFLKRKDGAKSLLKELSQIKKIKNKRELPSLIAHFNRLRVNAPFALWINVDSLDSSHYITEIDQSGLGLPDRDSYLGTDSRSRLLRQQYQNHIEKLLALTGVQNAEQQATDIAAFEVSLAQIQWNSIDNRNVLKITNRLTIQQLASISPDFSWPAYFSAMKLNLNSAQLNVRQPSYLGNLNQLIHDTSLATLKEYFAWRFIDNYAELMGDDFATEEFSFHKKILTGQMKAVSEPDRALELVDGLLGDALGQIYVQRYFSDQDKRRVEKIAMNIVAIFREKLHQSSWMSKTAQKEAVAKLGTLNLQIAYPSKWTNYSNLFISKDDLIGNVMRASEFLSQTEIAKLGTRVDSSHWESTPQTVSGNSIYETNTIEIPAAILQEPMFNRNADEAVNYGGIGRLIAHEISHLFDDRGRLYDHNGNLHEWWASEDVANFSKKCKALVEQYNSYEPLPGYHVNGNLTLSENIADNAGLEISYLAYKLSLADKPSSNIDGFSGEERFFIGYAQSMRVKLRDETLAIRLKSSVHAPDSVRINGAVTNQDAYYQVFRVTPNDLMFVRPNQRVQMW